MALMTIDLCSPAKILDRFSPTLSNSLTSAPANTVQVEQKNKRPEKPKTNKAIKPRSSADKELKKLSKQLEQAENDIETLEKLKKQVENEMSKPDVYSNPNKLAELNIKLNHNLSELKIKNKDWEFIAEQIDDLGQ